MSTFTRGRGGGRRVTADEFRRLGNGEHGHCTKMGEVREAFLASCRLRNLRPETIDWYSGRLGRFWPDPEQPISEALTVSAVRSRVEDLLESGLKPQTINGYLRIAKGIINWAKLEGIAAEADALNLARLPYLKEDRERQRVIEVEELERLLAAPDPRAAAGSRDRAMMALMADSGLRVGELTRILVDDVSLSPPTVTIRASASKSRWTRTVAMSEPMIAYLRAWLGTRRTSVPDECPWLFPSLTTLAPLDRHSVNHFLAKYAGKAGVKGPLGPHCFRRTFATVALRDHAPDCSVQGTMGHRTIRMTHEYAQLDDRYSWQATVEHSRS